MSDATRLVSLGGVLVASGLLHVSAALALGVSQWPGVALVALGAFVVSLFSYKGRSDENMSSGIDAVNVRITRIHEAVESQKSLLADTASRVDSLMLRRM